MIKTILVAACLPLMSGVLGAFDQTHELWNKVAAKRVDGARFDYAGLKNDRSGLDRYLDSVAAVKKSEFQQWSDGDRLAFLINLYNAATVRLVIDHYPVKSIREIGGSQGPWKLPVVRVFGGKVTLDHLEHEMIRAEFREPRIHFAVNCASVGCPPLLDEAFTGVKLELQLRKQTADFMKDRSVNRLEGGSLRLSALFDWFKEDFVRPAGSVEKFVAPYFPERDAKKILAGVKIEYGDYDWSLNGK